MNAQYTNTFLMNCYQGAANGWAGVPLISTAKRRSPRNKSTNSNGGGGVAFNAIDVKDFPGPGGSSMSKMALHAQGPPIILNVNNNNCGGSQGGARHPSNGPSCRVQSAMAMRYRNKPNQNAHRVQRHQFNGGQVRLLSGGHDDNNINNNNIGNNHHCERAMKFVADENSSILSNSSSSSSSGGNSGDTNSMVADACLPRIIKPRKRRKKERKPGVGGGSFSSDGDRENHHQGNHQLTPRTGSEEDFEDDEAVVSDYTTACSCRLCDPHSHIWSFPLRRGCSLENEVGDDDCDHFADIPGHDANDLYQSTGKSQKAQLHLPQQQQQQRPKDVGVIGGNRVNQQRNEWRGSPPQASLLCDNGLLNAKLLDSTTSQPRDLLLMGMSRGSALWPDAVLDEHQRGLSDEDSTDSFSCRNGFTATTTEKYPGHDDPLLHLHRNSLNYCGLQSVGCCEEDEELLIENLANLLNVSSSECSPKDSPKSEPRSSDSSGISSGSDCGSVFGECYSPLVNLGSPPSIAFNFSPGVLFPMIDTGLLTQAVKDNRRPAAQDEEADDVKHQQQHVMNCLDMDWYRAATTNRRLLQPFSSN